MKLETNLSENREQLGNKLFLREIGHGKNQKIKKKSNVLSMRQTFMSLIKMFNSSTSTVVFLSHCHLSTVNQTGEWSGV